MILFVPYAIVAWILVAKHRRAVAGLISLVLSVVILIGVSLLHAWASKATDGFINLPVLQSMLLPYTVLVGGVGLYIFVLPRRTENHCRHCGYDIRSLLEEFRNVRCPECGKMHRRDGRGIRDASGDDNPIADPVAASREGEQMTSARDAA